MEPLESPRPDLIKSNQIDQITRINSRKWVSLVIFSILPVSTNSSPLNSSLACRSIPVLAQILDPIRLKMSLIATGDILTWNQKGCTWLYTV